MRLQLYQHSLTFFCDIKLEVSKKQRLKLNETLQLLICANENYSCENINGLKKILKFCYVLVRNLVRN